MKNARPSKTTSPPLKTRLTFYHIIACLPPLNQNCHVFIERKAEWISSFDGKNYLSYLHRAKMHPLCDQTLKWTHKGYSTSPSVPDCPELFLTTNLYNVYFIVFYKPCHRFLHMTLWLVREEKNLQLRSCIWILNPERNDSKPWEFKRGLASQSNKIDK